MAEAGSEASGGEEEGGGTRKGRGRPRLTDSDRARRRLESRKKYDVRRVYLGEAHPAWTRLRGQRGCSDAGLAAYLLGLERGAARGEPWEKIPNKTKQDKRRRRNVNCVKNLVIWYEDHKNRCPFEPLLSELDPMFGLYTTAVWQCEAGHRYFQDLRAPLKPQSDSECESEKVGNSVGGDSSDSSAGSTSSETEEAQQPPTDFCQSSSQQGSLQQEQATQDGVPLSFEQHHVNAQCAEQSPPQTCQDPHASRGSEDLETVVCVPVPMHVDQNQGTLYNSETREDLNEVVGGCPMQSMVQGSQVIIIAGHGYEALTAEGIRMNVTSNGGEAIPCTMVEGVAAYTQTEPLNDGGAEQLQPTDSLERLATKTVKPRAVVHAGTFDRFMAQDVKEQEELCTLTKEEEEEAALGQLEGDAALDPESGLDPVTALHPVLQGLETVQGSFDLETASAKSESRDVSAIVYEIPREPEKRRSKRGCLTDADGLLEMFHCPYEGCSQVYVALSSFQNHVNLVHRKGKTKVCPHPGCGKKFYLANHLGRHMIIHSGVREFTCETCGKSFKRKNHLDVHRRTHTGETPLQCEICGYQCRQRSSLNWHMKKHTSEVHYNFTCEHCGKRFEKLDSVKFHKLKSHPDHKDT